ncbi:unnamed protein product [Prunus brigantina]
MSIKSLTFLNLKQNQSCIGQVACSRKYFPKPVAFPNQRSLIIPNPPHKPLPLKNKIQIGKPPKMGSPSSRTPPLFAFIFVCAILAAHLVHASSAAVDFSGGHQLGQLSWVSSRSAGGLIAEDEDLELPMESEISRRILATNRYISYGALRRNTVPCSRRGASYYNCRPGAQANPYSRGCSAITRCRH